MNKLTLCLLFSLFSASSLPSAQANAQQFTIEHLEPMSWWVGMKSNSLQLMVHGADIATLTPKINSKHLIINKVHRPKNSNYLFIDLSLQNTLTADNYSIDFYHGDKKVLSHNFPINQRNQNSAAQASYRPKDVIYLITPDRFANGDPSNDASANMIEQPNRTKKGGRHGGDIQGIINALPYLKDMGFTQIWTNPMVENNQESYSYHGYSATDFYHIDPRFGTNALYRELSDRAQQQGIGIIKDVVLNHIGSNHWWLNDLPMADWFNHQQTVSQPERFIGTHHKRESLHDPHATETDKTRFTDGWFVPSMPDLNQRNPFLATYLMQNTIWWIEFANLSGLRVDTYSYSDRAFLTEWSKRVTEEYPNINIVGEEWTTNPAHVAYWQRSKENYDGYVSYLPSVMDFPLQEAMINALTTQDNWNTGLNLLYRAIANDFLYADPYNLVTFADNHDMSRVYTQLKQNIADYKIAMSILLTTRGIPQIFYGTEIIMNNQGTDDHGVIRSGFPGGWPTDQQNAFKQIELTDKQIEAQNFVKFLLNWRKGNEAIHRGKLTHFAPESGIYVYFRTLGKNNDVMVVVNKNNTDVTLNTNDYREVLSHYNGAVNIRSKVQHSLKQPLTVAAKSAQIFTLNK